MVQEQFAPPSVSRLRAFFESGQVIKNPVDVLSKHLSEQGDTYYYPLAGVKKVLVSINPKVLKHILKDNHQNYHKSEIQARRIGDFLGANLLNSEGGHWLRQRRLIQQWFRDDNLAFMASAMCSSLEESLTRFEEDIRRGPIDICAQLAAMTLRIVFRSLCSAGLNDEEMRLIRQTVSQIDAFILRQFALPFLAPWFTLSAELRKLEVMRSKCEQFVLNHIRRRRTNGDRTGDLLQTLLDARYDDTGDGMTDEQILSEIKLFIVAGHGTSSNALSWTLYLLSRHPEYLRRAREELNAVVGNGPFQFSHVAKLPLTRRIVDESLRLYPPFWLVDRVALKDDRAGDVPIPKGTTIIAFIYGAHRAPAYWRDPDDFVPERFEDDRNSHSGFRYLPFGSGPRGCIGGSYAMLQMLMILNAFLRRYDFMLISDEVIKPRPTVFLRPENGISMRFERLRGKET